MNLSQFLTLKMGNKFIFKEPLNAIKSLNNNNVQRNNYYSPNNYNNQRNNQKRNYANMDIIPKFIANESMQELNKELLSRLSHKKVIFDKMVKNYFSQREENYSNSIQEIENEINNEKQISESAINKDYEGFKVLLSFINNNRTNPKLTAMQNISIDEYKNMNKETKNQIFGGIFENRPLIGQKLNLRNVNTKPNYNMNNNPYSIYNNMQRNNEKRNVSNNNINVNWNQGMAKNVQIRITQDQFDLFRRFVGNPNITDKEILSYFDMTNPKVMIAADRYFKKKYGAECLTLNYYFPYQPNLGIKVHKFRFVSEINDLFMAAHKDHLTINEPKIYAENGKQIMNDKRIKCLGALGLVNNSKIKIIL